MSEKATTNQKALLRCLTYRTSATRNGGLNSWICRIAFCVLTFVSPIDSTMSQQLSERIPAEPELLSFDELVTLSLTDKPPEPLKSKLQRLLTLPIINNQPESARVQPQPLESDLGPVVRAVFWNIARGSEFDLIRLAFSDPDEFERMAMQKGQSDSVALAQIEEQLHILREADVLVLNEVDLGMKRTDYRDVARELAQALHMNYAYGVEFVELDRLEDLGLEPVKLDDPNLAQQLQEEFSADPRRYRGLHGNAILSRYPIQKARMDRLPVCHDWYVTEKQAISHLERGKQVAANQLFLERIEREVRLGGRMALIADLAVPDVPEGSVTVISTHLENKSKPDCRRKQMDALLATIRDIDKPVILAGDLNTSGRDGTPTSIRREIMKRVKNYEFWTTQALKWATPASLPLLALTPVKYFKNYLDPTSGHVPIIWGNREAGLFRNVEQFRFKDRRAFDFRGNTERTRRGKERTLANSNQRGTKGFLPTFSVKRDYGGLVGRYKLDWFFVKPFIPQPRGKAMSYRFAPHYPMTMEDLNNAIPDGISDHYPMAVDLPLKEPMRDGK